MVAKDVQHHQDDSRLPASTPTPSGRLGRAGPAVLQFAYMGVHSLTAAYAVDDVTSPSYHSPRAVQTLLPVTVTEPLQRHTPNSMRLRIDPPEEDTKQQQLHNDSNLDNDDEYDEDMPQAVTANTANAFDAVAHATDASAPWILTVGTAPSSPLPLPLPTATPAVNGSWTLTFDATPIKTATATTTGSNCKHSVKPSTSTPPASLAQYRVAGAARRRRPHPVRIEFKTLIGVPVTNLDAAKLAAARRTAVQRGSELFRRHRAMFAGQLVKKLRQANPGFQILEAPRQLVSNGPQPACALELVRCDAAATATALPPQRVRVVC